MGSTEDLPGFVAITRPVGAAASTPPARDGLKVESWGMPALAEGGVAVVSPLARGRGGDLSPADVARTFATGPEQLMQLLPPFAAVGVKDGSVTALADSMGFRPLYSGLDGHGRAAVSTSARSVAQGIAARLDVRGVAIQSLLGWQLGQRTLFERVTKLAPGQVAHLGSGGLRLTGGATAPVAPLSLDEAVRAAARVLREGVGALLDEHPDAVLQLTGGQDSRLLLSAVPSQRRRSLAAMTLEVEGSDDAKVARALAGLCGFRHEVRRLSGLESVGAAEAWELCLDAASRLDSMADPVALASLGVGERQFDQGMRISGLGGEVARGFYYLGRVHDRQVTRTAARRLGDWRMFVNEAVEPGLLDEEFAAWAVQAAHEDLYEALLAGGDEWFRATDHLYLRHRMQRWAGLTDVAVGYQRTVVNPMLDPEFLEIASRLRPQDKSGSLFLGRLQVELDGDLARIPLEGRPAPVYYAYPGPRAALRRALADGQRTAAKVSQRVRGRNRPPAGGTQLAALVVEHWRRRPEVLDRVRTQDFVEARWMEEMLAGDLQPRPTSVAFLVNLAQALRAVPTVGDTPARV